MKKRLLASLMSLCLIVGLLPTAAFAVEADTTEEAPQAVVCEVTPGCTLEAGHEGDCVVAPAEGNSSEQENDPDAQPGGENGSEPADPVCGKLAGCVGDTHDPECPLYVAPVEPDEEPEEVPAPVEPAEENVILDPVPVVEDELSGTCGAEGNENSVTWALTQNEDESTYTLTISGSGAMADYIVSTSEDTRPWSAYKETITEVSISEGVTSIGNSAFRSMTALKKTNIPASITDLGDHIFRDDSALTTVEWGAGFNAPSITDTDSNSDTYTGTYVPTSMFDGCTSLGNGQELSEWLPDSFTGVGCAAFRNTAFSVDFDSWDELSYIGAYGFASMPNLTTVTVKNDWTFGLRDPNTCAAFQSSGLTAVTIEAGVESVLNTMFNDCTSLTSVSLPESVKKICASAFADTTSLQSIALNKVEEIDNYAFYGSGLKALTLPESITSIEKRAFLACSALESLYINSKEATVENLAFAGCTALKTIETAANTVVTLNSAFAADSSIDDAGAACTNVTELTAKGTLNGNIAELSGLKTLSVDGSSGQGDNGVLTNADRLPAVENLIITGDEWKVGNYTFAKQNNIKNLIVTADTVTCEDSAEAAFRSNETIETVQFTSNNVKLQRQMFMGCSALKWIDLSKVNTVTFENNCFGNDTNTEYTGGETNYFNKSCVIYVQNSTDATNARKVAANGAGIILVVNGGEVDTSATTPGFAAVSKASSILGGWYANSDFTGESVTSPTAGQTYYAKWIGMNDMDLQYGGSHKITVTGVELSGFQSDNTSVATVAFDGTVTAAGVGTATISATGTYNGQQTTFKATVTVTPRVLSYWNKDSEPQENPGSITYAVSEEHQNISDLLTFKWKDEPKTEVALTDGTDIDYTYTVPTENGGSGIEATVDFLPMPQGEYQVKFNLVNPNYTFAKTGGGTTDTLTITANVTAEGMARAYIAAVKPTEAAFIYDGTGKLPAAGTLTAYKEDSTSSETVDIGDFTIHIEGLNDTTFSSTADGIKAGTNLSEISGLMLPSTPGAYVITVSAANESYYIYKSQVFNIQKATVTIKPNDKTAYVGDEVPALGAEDYTVTGLVGNDTLTTAPKLSYASTPDMSTTGTYTIKASGAVANDDLYNLAYEDGTLTVSRRSSGGGGGSSSTNYSISTPSNVDNGSIKVSPTRASKGSTVTITVKPDEGYVLDELVVTDKNGDTVKLTDKGNGKYTFKMPASKVEIEVSFTLAADPDVNQPFVDVSPDAYYADAVAWAVGNGITNGTSATTFGPDVSCTRAQMVTFLWRAAGSPEPTTANNPFTDVQAGSYYYDAVLWAVEQGITSGTSATTFAPDATVTRAQTVTFLYRAAGSPAVSGGSFADISADAYYADAVAWAVSEGVTVGTSDTTFSPNMNCTRAQIVTFMYRAEQ